MALHGEIKVGGSELWAWEAVRVQDGPDGINTYRWCLLRDDAVVAAGQLVHHYDDGAVALAATVLEAACANLDPDRARPVPDGMEDGEPG